MDSAEGVVAAGGESRDFRRNLGNSALVWLGLVAYLALVQIVILVVGGDLQADPRSVLFSWPFLAGFGAAGLAGVFFASRTGFPAAWDERVSNRYRLLLPFAIGAGLGLVSTVIEQFTNSIQMFNAERGLAQFNVPFPGSLFFYSGGAILVEVLYRLLPVPLLLWLISNVGLQGRGQATTFWALAVLSSAIEPVTQLGQANTLAQGLPFVMALAVPGYALNFAQAVFFRRYGFLASIFVRLGHYSIWHIVYGNFICGC